MQNGQGILDNIARLRDNWDGDDSPAPSLEVIRVAKEMVHLFTDAGQEIYNIAPGPVGEIMLDLRSRDRMLELIIYPDKINYVKFSSSASPVQGLVTPDMSFENLLDWLRKQEEEPSSRCNTIT